MHAVLVISHKDLPHLHRLIERLLADPAVKVYVHTDTRWKVNSTDFANFGDRVRHLSKTRVLWGDFSVVEATLALLEECLKDKPEWVTLISGDSYPVGTPSKLAELLRTRRARVAINLTAFPNMALNKDLSRLTRWYFRIDHRSSPMAKVLDKLSRIATRRHLDRLTDGRNLFCGSQWWSMDGQVAVDALRLSEAWVGLTTLAQHSLVPDEFYFHTIVGQLVEPSEIAPSVMFADFDGPGPVPLVLTLSRHAFLAEGAPTSSTPYGSQQIFFARKFSSAHTDLLDAIDLSEAEIPKDATP